MLALWNDQSGAIISAELTLLTTIIVLGLTAGARQVAEALNGELAGLAHSIASVRQSYTPPGVAANGTPAAPEPPGVAVGAEPAAIVGER